MSNPRAKEQRDYDVHNLIPTCDKQDRKLFGYWKRSEAENVAPVVFRPDLVAARNNRS